VLAGEEAIDRFQHGDALRKCEVSRPFVWC
jgi:hypothetical protein